MITVNKRRTRVLLGKKHRQPLVITRGCLSKGLVLLLQLLLTAFFTSPTSLLKTEEATAAY